MSNIKPRGTKTMLHIVKTMVKSKDFWFNFFGWFGIYVAACDIANYIAHNATQVFFLRFVLLTIWFFVQEYKKRKAD